MARNERELTIHVPLDKCINAMLLDSDQEVATYELTDADGGGEVSVQVLGKVWVKFNDSYYDKASQMPDELLEIISSGELWDDERVYVSENNWFEAILFREDSNGSQSFVLDGWQSEGELRSALDDCIEYLGWAQHE